MHTESFIVVAFCREHIQDNVNPQLRASIKSGSHACLIKLTRCKVKGKGRKFLFFFKLTARDIVVLVSINKEESLARAAQLEYK